MRADKWGQILRIPIMILLAVVLAFTVAVGQVYIGYCRKYGLVRFTRAVLQTIEKGSL
jgi:hypothetical protein